MSGLRRVLVTGASRDNARYTGTRKNLRCGATSSSPQERCWPGTAA